MATMLEPRIVPDTLRQAQRGVVHRLARAAPLARSSAGRRRVLYRHRRAGGGGLQPGTRSAVAVQFADAAGAVGHRGGGHPGGCLASARPPAAAAVGRSRSGAVARSARAEGGSTDCQRAATARAGRGLRFARDGARRGDRVLPGVGPRRSGGNVQRVAAQQAVSGLRRVAAVGGRLLRIIAGHGRSVGAALAGRLDGALAARHVLEHFGAGRRRELAGAARRDVAVANQRAAGVRAG